MSASSSRLGTRARGKSGGVIRETLYLSSFVQVYERKRGGRGRRPDRPTSRASRCSSARVRPRRAVLYYPRNVTSTRMQHARTDRALVALINVQSARKRGKERKNRAWKKNCRSEKQLRQIATGAAPRYLRVARRTAMLRDPRYSIRIVNADNAQ